MNTYDVIVCGAGSAGFCAAIAIKDKVEVKDVSVDKVKYTLDKNDAIIPGKERYFVNEF